MENFKTIEINESNRVAVTYDLTQQTLGEVIGDGVYVHFLNPNLVHNSSSSPITADLTQVIDETTWEHDTRRPYSEVLIPAVGKFLETNGYDWMEITLTGYSQGEWAWALMFKPKAETPDLDFDLKVCLPAVDAWFKGDIFTVTHETLEIYTKLTDGSILERWEPADSIGGVIFNDCFDDAEIIETAKHYFDLCETKPCIKCQTAVKSDTWSEEMGFCVPCQHAYFNEAAN